MFAAIRALLLGLFLVLAVLALVGLWLAPPQSALRTPLPARAPTGDSPQILRLERGATFPGSGLFRIGAEWIEIRRCTPEGRPVALGPLVAQNPDTFLVVQRGARGSPIEAHEFGAKVTVEGGTFLPAAEGPFAAEVDGLFDIVLVLTGIAFILTQAFLAAAILRGLHVARPDAPSHGRLGLELFWTVLVLGVLLWLAFQQEATFERIKDPRFFPDPGPIEADFETRWGDATAAGGRLRPIEVQILAVRYQWAFRLAGRDGRFATEDDVVSSVLTLPTGRDILFTMRAMDVIHSFFLPHFRLKQDAVPGLAVQGWFRAEAPGSFPILCAELCGSGHTYMSGEMKILPPDEWLDWFEDRTVEAVLDHLGADPKASDFDPEDLDPLPRPEWFGAAMSKFWWWWDSHPLTPGYAGERSTR